jgi:hypothetical protein
MTTCDRDAAGPMPSGPPYRQPLSSICTDDVLKNHEDRLQILEGYHQLVMELSSTQKYMTNKVVIPLIVAVILLGISNVIHCFFYT